jgi:hypothetical protein
MNILVCKDKDKLFCKNGLLKSIKHVFSHYYFLHMWHASKARNFELNGYKKVAKLFNIGIISLVVLFFEIQDFEIFTWFFFSSNWNNEHVVA